MATESHSHTSGVWQAGKGVLEPEGAFLPMSGRSHVIEEN